MAHGGEEGAVHLTKLKFPCGCENRILRIRHCASSSLKTEMDGSK